MRDEEDTYRLALFSFPPRCSFHSEVASAPLGHRHRLDRWRDIVGELCLPLPVSQNLQWVFQGHRRVLSRKTRAWLLGSVRWQQHRAFQASTGVGLRETSTQPAGDHTQHSAWGSCCCQARGEGAALQPPEQGTNHPRQVQRGPPYLGARWAWLASFSLEESTGGGYSAQTPESWCADPWVIAGDLEAVCCLLPSLVSVVIICGRMLPGLSPRQFLGT